MRSAARSGPSPAGFWKELERFGRFEGTGEVVAELDIPTGPLAVSVEDYPDVEDLAFELTGPGGDPLEVKRYAARDLDDGRGLKNLDRVATLEVESPGLHHLRIKAPNDYEPLLVLVGQGLTVTGEFRRMGAEMIPGAKLWKRLGGG